MPEPDKLTALETAIRKFVAADSFPQAQSLLDDYVKEVESQLRAAGQEKLPDLESRTLRLFEWVGAMVQASRQYSAAQLTHLQLIGGYREPAGVLNPAATEAQTA